MPSLRNILLAAALVATLGASLFDVPGLDMPQVELADPARAATATTVAHTPPKAQETPLVRDRFEAPVADLFSSRSWQPPPPAPSKPPPPKAPPLPFRYLGKVLDEGAVMAFVGQDVRTHLLRAGDLLADYKVEEITPAGMTFVYLPLNEKQRLTFGSAN